MASYSFIIDYSQGKLREHDHEAGTSIRDICQPNVVFSPYFSTNFNSTTGLPLAFAIDPTDVVNPVSVAADGVSVFLLDAMACRVLRFSTAGELQETFGGKRGIGTGKISPDASKRSIIAFVNGKVFVTDNDDGSGGSGTGFIVRFDTAGTWEADYSIAAWITALTAVATFDQVTGWAYDTGRHCYWALAQGSATCYLLQIDLTGTPTGSVIDLTARLAIPGHSNTPLGRILTRGLRYHNGYLYLWSDSKIYRVDPSNTAGDQTVVTASQSVVQGGLTSDGSELTYTVQNGTNGTTPIKVLTLATNSTRAYGYAVNPPDGLTGHIADAWEIAVVPTAEDPSAQIARDLTLRARISALATRLLQLRTSIRGRVSRTLQLRAHILTGTQKKLQLRARIDEPTTIADAVVESWDLEDSLGTYSKGLALHARSLDGFAIGGELTLHAGYDETRVRLGKFVIDDISQATLPKEESFEISCRDVGALELDSILVTKTWQVQFPRTSVDLPSVKAFQILQEAAIAAQVTLGVIEIPDYPLYGNFVAHQQSFIQIAQALIEPWNLFPHEQYYVQVREGIVSILRRDFTTIPGNGYVIPRSHMKSLTRKKTRYLQSPRLTAFTDFVVKGVSVTLSILEEIGPQTRIEYFHNTTQLDEITIQVETNGKKDNVPVRQWVDTDTTSTETTWNDKILSREEVTYTTLHQRSLDVDNPLITDERRMAARSTEDYLYREPTGPLGYDSVQSASAGPSSIALLIQTNSLTEGIDSTDSKFKELNRSMTQYQYDASNQIAIETQSVTEYDTTEKQWKLTTCSQRTHSQTTAGSVRVHRTSFGIENGSISFSDVDSQQVGGSRPNPTNIAGRSNVMAFQAIAPAPQIVVDAPGFPGSHVTDPGGAHYVWSYENGFLGQHEVETIRANALVEKNLQSGGYHWDEISFVSILDPYIYSGMALKIETSQGIFEDFWCESVGDTFDTNQALTKVTAKRLTT